MKWSVALLTVSLLVGPARADVEEIAEVVPEPPDITSRVNELMQILERFKLVPDPALTSEEVMKAMVKQADPGGGLFSAEEADRMQAGAHGHLFEAGLRVVSTNEQIVITEVLADSGAEKAGIKAGDVIETLDKGIVSGMKAGDMTQLLRSASDVPVLLGIRDEAGAVRDVHVPMTASTAPAVDLAEDLPAGIAYARLNGIYEKSDREIISTLRRWVGGDTYGLVLDLRGAGGVNAEAAAAVASLFTQEGGMLFALRDIQDQDVEVFKARPAFQVDMPTMVLVDERTTGASEALAAALAGSARGVMLIGDMTRGDPLVREFLELPGNLKLYIATRRLVTADGTSYNGQQGVKPHITASRDVVPEFEPQLPEQMERKITEEEREDRRLRDRVRGDPVLRRAVDLLQGLRALNIGVSRVPEAAAR